MEVFESSRELEYSGSIIVLDTEEAIRQSTLLIEDLYEVDMEKISDDEIKAYSSIIVSMALEAEMIYDFKKVIVSCYAPQSFPSPKNHIDERSSALVASYMYDDIVPRIKDHYQVIFINIGRTVSFVRHGPDFRIYEWTLSREAAIEAEIEDGIEKAFNDSGYGLEDFTPPKT